MRWLLVALALCLPCAATAQTAADTTRDRGILQGLLEDNLSGAGRSVRIEGFAGAFSSRATFDELTIADDQGVWLTIRDGALDKIELRKGLKIEIGSISTGRADERDAVEQGKEQGQEQKQ